MRFHEFLLEYKREVTANKLGSKLLASAKREGVTDLDQLLAALEDMDPTPNKQYMVWIANQYINGQFRLEDAPRIKTTLERFIQTKNRLQEKDIGKYDFNNLEDTMEKIFSPAVGKTDQRTADTYEIPDEIKDEVEVLYNGPLGLLTIPKTEKASCILGSGTRWCTAGRQGNAFNAYNQRGPLYIWRDKNGEKYQFHVGINSHINHLTYQFVDSKDHKLTAPVVRNFAQNHPVLKKLFELFNKKILAVADENFDSDIINYIEDVFGLNKRWPELEKDILKDPHVAWLYAYRIIEGRWPEAEATIAKNGMASYEYAKKVLKDRFPTGEKAISKSSHAAFLYSKDILKGRFPEAEPVIATSPEDSFSYAQYAVKGKWPEGERAIAYSPYLAARYATEIIKDRFPEGERMIATAPNAATSYAKNILKQRWPAAEPAILTNTGTAIEYARDVIKGRWPELERSLLKQNLQYEQYGYEFVPKAVYEYLRQVVKRRKTKPWLEGEEIIAKNPSAAYKYAKNVVRGRWKAGEDSIIKSKNPKIPLKYAQYIIKGPWPEAEKRFAANSLMAVTYADTIIEGRWPPGEKAIAKSATNSLHYAQEVLKGRFPEGESEILTDPLTAWWYARNVIGGRWPEGESVILSNAGTKKWYKEFLNSIKRKQKK